eukprot:scaffold72840_cov14-Tisochrysis_lutea.AAC.1
MTCCIMQRMAIRLGAFFIPGCSGCSSDWALGACSLQPVLEPWAVFSHLPQTNVRRPTRCT